MTYAWNWCVVSATIRLMRIQIQDAHTLVQWYDRNRRNLPWRDTGNPYDIWLSEIMLQQTRIEAVREKFILIRNQLPDIHSLAECTEEKLLRLWEGLGYYSRARNLHRCAITLVKEYDGKLPADYDQLLSLPGIGPYTAGAIASIAFGIPVPAVDGNVMRVIARLYKITEDVRNPSTKAMIEQMIKDLFHQDHDSHFVSSFNQGLMELGETVCLPNGTPQCEKCPLHHDCKTYQSGLWKEIPYRSAQRKRTVQNRTLLIIRDQQRFLIHRRPSSGLLAGMYEFYGVNGHLNRKKAVEHAQQLGFYPISIHSLPSSTHIFTHLEWHMKAYEITVADASDFNQQDYLLVDETQLADLPIPSAFRTYTVLYALRKEKNG